MDEKKPGLSLRMMRHWTPPAPDPTLFDLVLYLASVDPRDDDTPYATKLADAGAYVRLHRH